MAAMIPNKGDVLELLELARDGARCRGYRGVRWGFTISTDRITERDVRSPDDPLLGEVGLKACTVAGEQLWLTPRLVDSLGPVILQGECRAFVYSADPTAGYDEPLSELRIVLCPAPSPEHFEGWMRFEGVFEAGDSRVLACLCEERPAGWPP
jgi:hypothetical protein